MNNVFCRNKNSNGSCLLAFVVKVLIVMVVAEMAIYVYSMSIGDESNIDDFIKSLLRMMLVAVGICVINGMGRKNKACNDSEQSQPDEQLAQDVDNDELKQWPNIDALTRTSNERGLTISVLELMALADRYGHKLSIGMIKIEGVAELNDTDTEELMIQTAGLMTESLRMPDRIGRFKDNIFMALLPESDIDGAAIVAERLHNNLQTDSPAVAKKVTYWIGMTEFHRGEDLQSLLDRVELAMNEAENENNGICVKP